MYADQSNNPNDLNQFYFNQRQADFQRIKGGSWSQPDWSGFHPIIGAGYARYGNDEFLQRYAQDGDSGFFFRKGLNGGAEPLGAHHLPLNSMDEGQEPIEYEDSKMSTMEPVTIEEPPSKPDDEELAIDTGFTAEPQQKANHVPPYSQMLIQGMGKDDVLYDEPLVIPEYKGSFHKKEKRFK